MKVGRPPTMLKSKEVAIMYDLSPDDVILAARQGKLRGEKRGKYWLFKLSDVKVWGRKIRKEQK